MALIFPLMITAIFGIVYASNKSTSDAVSKLFKVDVVKCNVMIVKGKPKYSRSRGGSVKGTTGNWKKAVVTLAKGDSIQAIEGV